ncbi:hypothetical protein CC85DRAFT_79516 [Cutaneotrichosporon oleaginosum]|uniref:Uncharacterized protein n=1 Tax=Cutaneotrichosporon oleaginosum TaxID=879819 RepID=A0A0J0XNE0_9TREE|nr:uncharacterized protein CC85DRAFT_79516 [Cutaneotrichosporon oleaginosum]KLT42592.1 hypothetical protein CC85DRAFT_79516 [Cutaneotrichosporon oleaginosum]TXT05291.1 hypothetical protein COLE_06611 [Cutaneotrichosporon oleaginosum]
MPVHLVSESLGGIPNPTLVLAALGGITAYGLKIATGGRKSIWEREWAGKLIMVVAPPEPTTFALLHALLHLPSPPQILYLPPLPSPLPASLLTILHTLKIASTNPAAQLHCEPLPPTVSGVRDFVRKWSSPHKGTTGEEGRRVDAIVLGGGWECSATPFTDNERAALLQEGDGEKKWTVHQHHFHLVTSLLPSLLKAPAERDVRIVSLVSPAYSAAIPRLEKQLADPSSTGKEPGPLERAGADGLTTFFMNAHFRLILDALASASYSQRAAPDPSVPVPEMKKVEVTSNIKALSVVMPWARDEVVRPILGIWGWGWLWLLIYPLVLLFTPGPGMAVQSVLHALSAPVLYDEDRKTLSKGTGENEKTEGEKSEKKEGGRRKAEDDPRRAGIRQGDTVRDCAVIE